VPASFRLYNTLSRQVEPFEPLTPGKIGLYVCGMTVYDHAHVGHARAMVVFDTFVRWRRHRGWDVSFVRNFTDVDDKIIRRAVTEGVPAAEVAQRYIDAFHDECDALGLLRPDQEPRVSTSMSGIVAMIQRLIDDGHAYAAGGSVWFSVRTFPAYGRLSNQDIEAMQSGEEDSVKRDSLDFALWKAAKPDEPAWDSPWGPGRPGWHIECSAMTAETLGPTVDIHGGGLDLVFPHHENEVAQSECANHAPYVRYWMHNGLLTLVRRTDEGNVLAAKMGKSLGNAFNIRDAVRQFPAEALRLYYLATHYRSPLPWSDESLPEALAMLARLYEAREVAAAMSGEGAAAAVAAELGPDAEEVLRLASTLPERLTADLDDDLNTASALGQAFELARAINRLGNHKKSRAKGGPIGRVAAAAFDTLRVIGLLTLSTDAFQEEVKDKRLSALGIDRAQVEALIAARLAARTAKDWATADALRQQLDTIGVVVMDGADGVQWRVRLSDPAKA
jgi:cysteinyl-tRNA synthetase